MFGCFFHNSDEERDEEEESKLDFYHLVQNTVLNLSSIDLTDDQVAELASAMVGPRAIVKELWLGYNQITATGAKVLAGSIRQLRMLCLSGNSIGDEGAKAIAQGLGPEIETLRLSNNQIGPSGTKALAEALPGKCHLESLYLSHNPLQDDGARAISTSLPEVTCMQLLAIESISITNYGADALLIGLRKSTSIAQVRLDHNNINMQYHWSIEALINDRELPIANTKYYRKERNGTVSVMKNRR